MNNISVEDIVVVTWGFFCCCCCGLFIYRIAVKFNYVHTSSRCLQLNTCFYFQVLNHTLLNPAFFVHRSSRFSTTLTCFSFQVLNHTLLSPAFFVGQGKTVFLEALGNFHVRNYIKERIALRSFSKIQTLSTPNRDVYNFTDGHLYTVGICRISSFIFKINLSNFNVQKIMVNRFKLSSTLSLVLCGG